MKNFLQFLIICTIALLVYFFKEPIIIFISDSISHEEKTEIETPSVNSYKTGNLDVAFLANTDNFVPTTRQEILNILYTILNSGWKEFTFYCPNEYEKCIDDVSEITNDDEYLSNINGYVHPYNTFKTIETSYTTRGKVTIKIHKVYTDEMITAINQRMEQIYAEKINPSMTEEQKIRTIHDYIIQTSKYDNDRISGGTQYQSNTAYGNLLQGYGICSGYTDSMAIFLYKMNIPNYKVSSATHIWNFVYINGKWLHLDLTYDDPVVNTGEEMLLHDYFLIDTKTLLKLDIKEHVFDGNTFIEAAAGL